MAINPVQFSHAVCDEFLRYLFSAFPLADPDLAAQAKRLVGRPSSLDIPLVKGPFISLSEPFAQGESVQALADRGLLHHAMPGLIGYPRMWLHQQKVFEAARRGENVLVSTGTGSGKTESFLYPIVDDLLRQRDRGTTSGLTAILIYPMNALSNDQLDRLREMLGGTGITFGQWIGTTPDKEGGVQLDRSESTSRAAYLAERRARREQAIKEERAVRPLAPPEECCSEEDIRTRQPRILLTNYRQLEILTTRYPDVKLFAEAPLKYLVFDEAHTYEGASGAEVACLIRRLRALAGKKPDEVTCIGTSATLADPEKKDDQQATRRFAARFFGVDLAKVTVVGESYVSRDWPKRRFRPRTPPVDDPTRLGRLLQSLSEPVNLTALRAVVEEITGEYFDPGERWQQALFDHMLANEYAFQATQVLKQPQPLVKAAWATSQRIAMGRLPEGERATSELLCYLVLGAAARKESEALLRPKVHFFIRGLDEMVVALGEQGGQTTAELFLSLADARERHADRREDAFFGVLTCRNCGQHFFEKHYQNLTCTRAANNQLRGFDGGDAVTADGGKDNAVWATAGEGAGTRLLTTHRLLEEAETGTTSSRSSRWPRVHVCRQCGALHREPAARCLSDGCGHPAPTVSLLALGDALSSCPSCSSPAIRIGGRSIEPAKKIRAVTVADVHILAQAMINAAPEANQKLIIFADSRQDAAFQAGWMQDHARRIRLRHLMHGLIAQHNPLSPAALTDRLGEMFRKDRGLIDTLLPELTGEESEAVFGHNLQNAVYLALKYMVYREFTTGVRRRDCLESMGLALVGYDGLNPKDDGLRAWADLLGISPDEAVNAVSLLLDLWRRNRYLHIPNDDVFTCYHPKDHPYIQAGLLPLREFRPEGLLLKAGAADRHARGLLAQRGASSAQALIRRWASNSASLDVDAAATVLWEYLTERGFLSRVTIRSAKEAKLGEVWQVSAEKLVLAPHDHIQRCTTCQRLAPRPAPKAACIRHHCAGHTVAERPDRDNYDVWLMGRPFTMVTAEEHTAQVPGEVRAVIEQEFKARHGRTNCLVATPTLEMGVNIGVLDMVLMRNVPPLAANYWQRAGRAGREERMAVVVTYCRRSNHDRYFFDDPLRLLGGAIEAPTFNLRNPLLVAKHVRSAILSDLLLKANDGSAGSDRVKRVLGALFPTFIRSYLLDDRDHFRGQPTDTATLAALLAERQDEMAARLGELFASHWGEEAKDVVARTAIEGVIGQTAAALGEVIRRLHGRLTWARTTRRDLFERKDRGLIEREEEQLLRRCDDYINSIVRSDRPTYTLTVLSVEGFLPGYGIYEGGVTASARRTPTGRKVGPRAFDLSRSNVVALREFVPGNRLYANRGTFYVGRYHLSAEGGGRSKALRVNVEKGYVTDHAGTAAYGQSGGVVIDAIPLADADLVHESRITAEENLRFSMPVLVLGRLLKPNRGGRAYKVGDSEVHHLRGQAVELVNLGEAGRVRAGNLGHLICSVCGAAKTPYAVPQETAQFLQLHKERCGNEPVPLVLATRAEVDLLQFHGLDGEAKAVNIGEAIRTAAARLLDMGPDDLQLLTVQRPDEKFDLLLYDPMPGGSGLLEQILERWPELIASAKELLVGCPQGCETACYACLKTFRNQFHHERLNRHDALGYIEQLDHPPAAYREIAPVVEEAKAQDGSPSNTPEARLNRLLAIHHFPEGKLRTPVQTSVPGMVTTPDWLHEPTKVAVYLDGMSRGLHGDPRTAQRDQLLRQLLELDSYKVIVVQSRDLDDPEAMRQHLRNIAEALGDGGLSHAIAEAATVVPTDAPVATSSSDPLTDLLAYADPSFHGLIRACAGRSLPLPEVGCELTAGTRGVCGSAELGWRERKVAVLLPERATDAREFEGQGWRVFAASDLPGVEDTILRMLSE
jgi:ATP-dependent helicase YprA (DUF1998 family)